jgi:hypothetical protein
LSSAASRPPLVVSGPGHAVELTRFRAEAAYCRQVDWQSIFWDVAADVPSDWSAACHDLSVESKLTVVGRTCPSPYTIHPITAQSRPLILDHPPRRIRTPQLIDKFGLLPLIWVDKVVERRDIELSDGCDTREPWPGIG